MSRVSVTIGGRDVTDRLRDSSVLQSLFGQTEVEVGLARFPSSPSFRDEIDGFLGKEFEISFRATEARGGPGARFKGSITRIEAGANGMSLYGVGSTLSLNQALKTRSFVEKSAQQIIRQVLSESGVPNRISGYTQSIEFDYMVQYDETDLQFVKRLARYDAMMVFDDGERLRVTSDLNSGKPLELTAEDLPDWPGTLTCEVLPTLMKGVSQHYLPFRTNEAEIARTASPAGSTWHGLIAGRADELFQDQTSRIHDRPVLNPAQMRDYLENRSRLRAGNMFRFLARSKHTGLRVGNPFKLKDHQGVTETLAITSLKSRFDRGRFESDFEAIPASAAVEPLATNGRPREVIETAEVIDNEDPDGLGRVKVKFSWDETGDACPWVRLVQAGAGTERGTAWTPLVGDQIVVGFEYGNPARPVALGLHYHSDFKPSFKTKNGTEEVLLARTASGTEIRIIDTEGKEEVIVHTEAGGKTNEIRLRAGKSPELLVKTTGKMALNAENIEIVANNAIMLKGKDVAIQGTSVKIN